MDKICKCGRPIPGGAKRCKQCRTLYDKGYFEAHAAPKTAAAVKRKRELMDWYKNLKDNKMCRDCMRPWRSWQLDYDHLPQFKKVDEVSHMVRIGLAKETIIAEIAKCELVCKNCHATRTHNRRANGEHI